MGAGASANKPPPPLVAHMRMLFAKYDVDMSGALEWGEFWNIMNDLELGFTDDDISAWQQFADKDQSGTVIWSEFEPFAMELIKQYFTSKSFEGDDPWKVKSDLEGREYRINQTNGENEWVNPKPMSHHLKHMCQLFQKHDSDQSGELEWEEFWNVLNELGLELTDKDIEEWQAFADADQNGSVKWSEFEPMAEVLIKQFYTGKEFTGDDPWVTMTDLDGNAYQVNQQTGEEREVPTEEEVQPKEKEQA
jgi:Ca2+-binding EF-hand superfamily protein